MSKQLRLLSLLRLIPPTFTPLVRSRANAGRIRMGIIYLTSQEFLDLTSSQSKLDRPELIMK